ncbi:MAG: Phage derived protein Gp49-like [Blastocatellia bacterium]|jgi:hypothetical protein|nr:Phage derived protein Gp49-like [Blastocatellia bacterium]
MGRSIWTFVEIETVGGRGVITDWVEDLDMEAEEDFHGILRGLEVAPRALWVRPVYDVFDPEIGEIRFKANGLQHRVFGFFLTELSRYVMLIGATKKGRSYNPRDAVNTARKRKKLIQSDRSQLRDYTDHKF